MAYRNRVTSEVATEQDIAQDVVTGYVTEVTQAYDLIGDYQKRPNAVEDLEKKVVAFNGKKINYDAVNKNNTYACKWLALLCTAGWFVFGGIRVLQGDEVGNFVTILSIFSDIGQCWEKIFEVMLKMQSSFPYLRKSVRYMNLPTDVEKRMRLNRKRRSHGEDMWKLARSNMAKAEEHGHHVTNAFAADFVPIVLQDLSYHHDPPLITHKRFEMQFSSHKHRKSGSEVQEHLEKVHQSFRDQHGADGTLEKCIMAFPQGALVTLVGEAGEGKSTVMRLLGSQILPKSGDMFIPSHLRTLHVSLEPQFFFDTLYANLTYGVTKENKEDGALNRVKDVLRELKLPQKIFSFLDAEDKSMFDVRADWNQILGITERVSLTLARALIANPEILIVHKPTVYLNDEAADNTFRCLNDFIIQRGLCMDRTKIMYRRPRTCLITTARPMGVEVADIVFRVTPTITKQIVRPQDIMREKEKVKKY
jgi:ABC-type multidrug transport system fused ATPase/permease subunit